MVDSRSVRMRWLSYGVLMGACLLAGRSNTVWAVGTETTLRGDDLVVTVNSKWCGNASGGYFPVRLRVVNKGRPREVTAVFMSAQAPTARKTVAVPQNATAQFTLSIPCVDQGGNYGQLRLLSNGRPVAGLADNVVLPDANNYAAPRPALLVIAPADVDCERFEEAVNHLQTAVAGSSPYYGYRSTSSDHENVRPQMLPESWLDYSGLDLVAVPLATLGALPEQERSAILNWVHTGGNLLVYDVGGPAKDSKELAGVLQLDRHAAASGEWKTSDVAQRQEIPLVADSSIGYSGMVAEVEAGSMAEISGEHPVWTPDAFARRNLMLGQVFAFPGNPFPGTRHDWFWLLQSVSDDRSQWTARQGMSARVGTRQFLEFLIPSVKGVPVTAFLVLITLFSVAIGPLNYLYFWKRQRLYLLLFTIPLVAFGTSLALFGYSVVAHGFGTRSRARTLTLLDQKSNTAVTTARVTLYAGLAPAQGLRFPTETAVFPIWPPDSGFESAAVDWTETQHLSSGWLRSRTRTQFLLVDHRDERGRLEISAPAGLHLTVANGFAWNIAALVVADPQGDLFYGTDIPAGASAELKRLIAQEDRSRLAEMLNRNSPGMPADAANYSGGPFSSPLMMSYYGQPEVPANFQMGLMEKNISYLKGLGTPNGTLAARSYMAVLNENPGIPLGVEKTSPEADVHLLVGHY